MNRRTALKVGASLGVVAGAGLYGVYRFLPPWRSRALEPVDVLARRLYTGLDPEQRAEACVDYDHPLRQYHNRGVWGGGRSVVFGFNRQQRQILTDLLYAGLSPEGRARVPEEYFTRWTGVHSMRVLICGDPAAPPYQVVLTGAQEATPLVYKGTMFLPNPADVLQAIDAATGDLIWEYRRPVPEDISKFLQGSPLKNRNIAIYGDKIIDLSVDTFVYAVEARSGKPAWQTRIQDYRELPAMQTSGPIAARGKVFSGRACEFSGKGEACVVTAHDANTGKELWRFHTIPKPGEPGDETWGGVPYEQRKHVGTWMPPSYDPELNLLYIGTSVTSPAPKFLLAGNDKKYLYHNSTLAIDADTGKLKWYYQHVVDHWDLDHPFERILVDTAVAPDASQVSWINPRIVPGERRKVITGIPGKTGIVYTLDRQTGEFLRARPTNFQNVVSRIDGATGTVTVSPEAIFTKAGEERLICPNMNGGKNFPAGAYSPLNNAIFMPVQNTCAIESAISDKIVPTSAYMVNTRPQLAPGVDKIGTIHAVSVETGKTLWKFEQRAGALSLVTTGGGLVLGGDTNGRFRAIDQDTGRILWEVNLGAPVTGYPVTYAVNGKQYVAVSTGTSLVSSGVNRLAPELKPGTSNNIFVFALP